MKERPMLSRLSRRLIPIVTIIVAGAPISRGDPKAASRPSRLSVRELDTDILDARAKELSIPEAVDIRATVGMERSSWLIEWHIQVNENNLSKLKNWGDGETRVKRAIC